MKKENLKKILSKQNLKTVLYILTGVAAGFIITYFFLPKSGTQSKENGKAVYSCSMDPQIRQDHPGICPICGMELTPVDKDGNPTGEMNADAVALSDEAMALANIETLVVWKEDAEKEISLFGSVKTDQRNEQTQTSYVSGRVEKVFVNAVGDKINKGQAFAKIYSPELYSAQMELLQANKIENEYQRNLLLKAAKEKLLLWNIEEKQINEILASQKANPYIILTANTSGTVIEKNISQGDYVQQGSPLLKIADLSRVWIVFSAYEKDMPFIRIGQQISFSSDALAGKQFFGKISYIEETLDSETRTFGIRVEMNNANRIFKPDMYVKGTLIAELKEYKDKVVLPKSAVLWTGKRSVVYIKDKESEKNVFTMRRVELGADLGTSYIVESGLEEGEEVVTNGAFTIDASAQLEGKASMLSEED
ncbi:MAG: efflux RND transporter periplasmic adaptor subunit [Bacteroidales bacterium]|nr:efflux RND transporter periplasmic adaptor subunit [Bacteroidales bacterium]